MKYSNKLAKPLNRRQTMKNKPKKQNLKKNETKSSSLFRFIISNAITLLLLWVLITGFILDINGYKWMKDKLITANIEFMQKSKDLNFEERNEVKLGYFFTYLNYINNSTPENAVILMPSDSVIKSVDEKYRLKNLTNRAITTYVIYPRKAVYKKHFPLDSALLKQITHVAIVNYQGYENLSYGTLISKKSMFAVYPTDLSQLKKKK